MGAFIDYTYHSHTARCGHARGADEDYAKTAFEHGISKGHPNQKDFERVLKNVSKLLSINRSQEQNKKLAK